MGSGLRRLSFRVDPEGAFKISRVLERGAPLEALKFTMAAGEAHWQIGVVETHIRLLENQLSLMEK